jgi:hypothetical protein
MSDNKDDDQLSDKEIAERMERALKRSFEMPHKPHKADKPMQPQRRPRAKKDRNPG